MQPILPNNLMVWVNRDINMPDLRSWRKITFVLILLAVPLFFIGGVSAFAPDVYRRLWDLGHAVFFALVAVNLVWWLIIKNHKQFVIAFLIVFGISLLIEKLQSFIGRDASWSDVLSNMSGFLLGYSFTQIVTKWMLLLRGLSILGLLPGFVAVLKSIILMFVLWQQFPLLSGGESHWESRVWGGRADISRIAAIENPDRVYRIGFSGSAYQSANLGGFIQPWTHHQKLILQIENPSNEKFELTMRISDKQHELSKQEYSDRFNRRIELSPGWNQIEIPINDIKNSPLKRTMNMEDIYVLKLFFSESGKAREIYLNRIFLE
jgi:VanZ family protein